MKLLSLIASFGLCCGAGVATAQNVQMTIGTGGEAGVYFPTGKAICEAVNKHASGTISECTAVNSGGSVANINGVRDGEFLFGIAQSDLTLPAYRGEGRFSDRDPYEDMRVVFSLHAEPLHVLVRDDSGIESIADFKGKFVSIGNPGSGTRALSDILLEIAGISVDDLALAAEIDASRQSDALCDGRIDALVLVAGLPNALTMQTTINCDVSLLNISNPETDQFLEENKAYAYATIPGGTYPHNPNDVVTWGPRAVLVTDANTPDAVVRQVVTSVVENLDGVREFHPALTFLDFTEMRSRGLSGPLHNGGLSVLFDN